MHVIRQLRISIHAPTRGATALVNAWFSVDGFQSTLPREERRTRSYQLRSTPKYFNPRSHERSDIEDQQARKPGIRFQSTLPREERLGRRAFLMELDEFQSTLPREERQYIHSLLILLTYFNPRSHERSDVLLHVLSYVFDISIHAPTRGATSPPS